MVPQSYMTKKTIAHTNAKVHAALAIKRAQREASAETKARIVALFDSVGVVRVDIELPL